MANDGIKNKLFAISPYIEIAFRKIYWNNINFFYEKVKKKAQVKVKDRKNINFDKIIDYLQNKGIGEGDLMILHSSYEEIKYSRLKPDQIIDKFLQLLGKEGTLAMNSGRKFKEEKDVTYCLKENYEDLVCEYDVKKTRVWTGVLPMFMLRRSNAEISEFPINPMVAIGKYAKLMMECNLTGDLKAHGKGSSWEYCWKHNAVIVGIGIDLTHSLTMVHTAEDTNEKWPILYWYRDRKFLIKNGLTEKIITVKERRPKWGSLHYAERTLCKDLINSRLLVSNIVEGVKVEYIYAQDLLNFLNSKNKNGYPYFGINKKNKV